MIERWRLNIQGTVQGVGFRPFVYRLAQETGTSGWVLNSSQGVVIEVEAEETTLGAFVDRLQGELPPHAAIYDIQLRAIPVCGERDFHIRHSHDTGIKSAFILPDLAICPECLRDITDPENRRYRYPFTNCTHCGPRFSIIEALPYDRPNTTMRQFIMCAECQAEYENPLDRRFHAQPNACPHCGPQLALWDRGGRVLAQRDDALRTAVAALRQGLIVAVKGLGGFHLLVDAGNPQAVALLRERKGRYEKPFAVMFPSIEQVEYACELTPLERQLITSPEAPIVLLRQQNNLLAPEIAPENPYLGAMLPYTPLHHLLLADQGSPVVATSGNLSGEPICIEEHDALTKLGHIADLFLVHNRQIARHVDDPVVCAAAGETLVLRRARGYAPKPIALPQASGKTILALGAHQKNTVALLHNGHAFLSQHLGDMDNAATFDAFRRTLTDLQTLYAAKPSAVACDLHPDYTTTHYAEQCLLPVSKIQHHYAHILSCMAENQIEAPVLGVAWDGTGLGTDGTIWGGEFLLVDDKNYTRIGHLRPFPLPGGEAAAREPRRSLLGLLYAMYGADLPRERLQFTPKELQLLLTALDKGINVPLTSSMGRLFDAVAALAGIRQRCSFEGQAAMALEFAAMGANTDECYPFQITPVTNANGIKKQMIEWKPMLTAMLAEVDTAAISAKFHNTLAAIIVQMAQQAGIPNIALSGGCFQNRLLLELTVARLRASGFTPYWQRQIPPNDGGIALGQIAAALREENLCV